MSLFTIFQIASQGMAAQRERLEAASSNLANANSTRTASGKAYQRRDVVLTTQDIDEQWRTSAGGSGLLDGPKPAGVRADIVMSDDTDVVPQYQPQNPAAGPDGYVNLPNVDPLEETVNMMSAARSFEANASVFSTAKDLARVSISLGDA